MENINRIITAAKNIREAALREAAAEAYRFYPTRVGRDIQRAIFALIDKVSA